MKHTEEVIKKAVKPLAQSHAHILICVNEIDHLKVKTSD